MSFWYLDYMTTPTGATIIMKPHLFNRKMAKLLQKAQDAMALAQEINQQYMSLKEEFPEFWKEYCEINDLDQTHTAIDKKECQTPKAIDTSKWDW